jgi:hypothetical protein
MEVLVWGKPNGQPNDIVSPNILQFGYDRLLVQSLHTWRSEKKIGLVWLIVSFGLRSLSRALLFFNSGGI